MTIDPADLIIPLIGIWCVCVYFIVPEASNPFPKTSRWWLSQKLFGGQRGVRMFAGLMVFSVLAGLLRLGNE